MSLGSISTSTSTLLLLNNIKTIPITKSTFSEVKDLQLAAELGRTLLDRNEELENELKTQQGIIDDQKQEIEFQLKQINSMKEESTSRSKFYDQLENSVFELERANSQLSKKHEVDKKRIQSMTENIDYLEKKCEELNGTLESIRDSNKKHAYNVNKLNRSSYFLQLNGLNGGGSSESSEDDSGYFRTRRTQSLQDLRDYSSSPDDLLDSSPSSNSPDLKLSENEFITSLESRIEELLSAKKKETDHVASLEAQLKLLIQENSNLHQQLAFTIKEKDDQIQVLEQQLIDHSIQSQSPLSSPSHRLLKNNQNTSISSPSNPIGVNFAIGSPTTPKFYNSISNSSSFSTPAAGTTTVRSMISKSQRNSLNYQRQQQLSSSSSSSPSSRGTRNTTAVCKRCSEEINILSLVNSIEDDQELLMDGGGEGRFGLMDDDHEFSSLEFELARATTNGGYSYDTLDNNNFLTHENNTQQQQNNNILVLRKSLPSTFNNNHTHNSSSNNRRLSFDLQDNIFGGLNYLFSNSLSKNGGHNTNNNLLHHNHHEFDELDYENELQEGAPAAEEFQSLPISEVQSNEVEAVIINDDSEKSCIAKRLKLPEKIEHVNNVTLASLESNKINSDLHSNDDGNSLDKFGAELNTSCTVGLRKRSKIQTKEDEDSKLFNNVDNNKNNNSRVDSTSVEESNSSSTSTIPEYKQILQTMFSLLRFGFTTGTGIEDSQDEDHHIC